MFDASAVVAATEARRRLAVNLPATLPERDVSATLPSTARKLASTTRAHRPRGPVASLFILLLQIPFPVVLAVQSVKAAGSRFPNSKMEVGSFRKLYTNASERTSSCDKDYIETNRDEMSQQGNKRIDRCADSGDQAVR
ncbi:hypothetical protein EJB05_27430, partial [Eragrostis curvula]